VGAVEVMSTQRKPQLLVRRTGWTVIAIRRQQIAAAAHTPRRTPQDTVRLIFVEPVQAPLPQVATHVVEPKLVRRKTATGDVFRKPSL